MKRVIMVLAGLALMLAVAVGCQTTASSASTSSVHEAIQADTTIW